MGRGMEYVVGLVIIVGIVWFLRRKKKAELPEPLRSTPEYPFIGGKIKSNDPRTWPKDAGIGDIERKKLDLEIRRMGLTWSELDLDDFRNADLLDSFPHGLGNPARKFLEMWEDPEAFDEIDRLRVILFFSFLNQSKWENARSLLVDYFMKGLPQDEKDALQFGSSLWASADELEAAGYPLEQHQMPDPTPGSLSLGRFLDEDLWLTPKLPGPSHLLMFAPTESGKNQRFIFENLLTYDGPLICLDPKGENYEMTAASRAGRGRVFKFAPWDGGDSDYFNPLDLVSTHDDCFVMANLLIPRPTWGEKFWTDSAQHVVAGCIYYLKKMCPPEKQNMEELYDIFTQGELEFREFVVTLTESPVKEVHRLGKTLSDYEEKVRQNIWATARVDLRVWGSPEVSAVTKTTSEGFNPMEIVRRAREGEAGNLRDDWIEGPSPGADSVYICVPPDKILPFAQVLRVVMGMMLSALTKKRPEGSGDRKARRPFLFLFDEVAQLGYMDIIEKMMPIARGYDVRLWLVFQSIAQLKDRYTESGTILENAHAQIFFGSIRGDTAEYLSRELGVKKDLHGGQTPLVVPSELAGPKYEGRFIMRLRKVKPVLGHLADMFITDDWWKEKRKEGEERYAAVLAKMRRERPKDDASLAAVRASR